MKKKHGVFFGFAVVLITAIFTVAGCDNNDGSDDDIWLADVSNPLIGEWKSDPDEDGVILVYTGKTDGTFDFEMQDLPIGAPYPASGSGAYIIRQDADGQKVSVSLFDFGLIKSTIINVVDNDTIKMTEFALIGAKKYTGSVTYLHRQTPVTSTENQPTVLPNNVFIGKIWSANIPEPEVPGTFYPTTWDFKNDGTVICTFIGLGEALGFSGQEDAPLPFSYVITDDTLMLYAQSLDGNEIRMHTFDEKTGGTIEVTRLLLAYDGLFLTDTPADAPLVYTPVP
jgi:hypothetical protein